MRREGKVSKGNEWFGRVEAKRGYAMISPAEVKQRYSLEARRYAL